MLSEKNESAEVITSYITYLPYARDVGKKQTKNKRYAYKQPRSNSAVAAALCAQQSLSLLRNRRFP